MAAASSVNTDQKKLKTSNSGADAGRWGAAARMRASADPAFCCALGCSTFNDVNCANCNKPLGKVYKCTPAAYDSFRDMFALNETALCA